MVIHILEANCSYDPNITFPGVFDLLLGHFWPFYGENHFFGLSTLENFASIMSSSYSENIVFGVLEASRGRAGNTHSRHIQIEHLEVFWTGISK